MELSEMNMYVLECARYGEDEDLRTLFKSGANVNHQDQYSGNTGLHCAAANNEVKCMQVLHEHGALHIANKQGNTPTHWAAQNGKADALRFLLEQYKDIDVLEKNKAGRSALTEAFQSQSQDCIELCLSHSSAEEDRLLDPNTTSERKIPATTSTTGETYSTSEVTGAKSNEESDAVTHNMIFRGTISTDKATKGDIDSQEVKSVGDVRISIRELPITRADNPFGSKSAPEDDTTGLSVWAASILLAQWLVHLESNEKNKWKGKVALELGAGCGLPGLVAARCCSLRSVYITDIHDPTLRNAAHNALANFPTSEHLCKPSTEAAIAERMAFYDSKYCIAVGGGAVNTPRVKVATMNWLDAESFPPEQADLLLGSDLVYDSDILAALVPAVCAMMSTDGRFLYVAPNTGRQGMDELKSALYAVGIDCVSEVPAPEEYYQNPFEDGDDDQMVLHFYDLAAKQPHTLYDFRWRSTEPLTMTASAAANTEHMPPLPPS